MSEPKPMLTIEYRIEPELETRWLGHKYCENKRCGKDLGNVGIDEIGYFILRPSGDVLRGDAKLYCEPDHGGCGEYTPWEYRRTKLPPFMARERGDWEELRDE